MFSRKSTRKAIEVYGVKKLLRDCSADQKRMAACYTQFRNYREEMSEQQTYRRDERGKVDFRDGPSRQIRYECFFSGLVCRSV